MEVTVVIRDRIEEAGGDGRIAKLRRQTPRVFYRRIWRVSGRDLRFSGYPVHLPRGRFEGYAQMVSQSPPRGFLRRYDNGRPFSGEGKRVENASVLENLSECGG